MLWDLYFGLFLLFFDLLPFYILCFWYEESSFSSTICNCVLDAHLIWKLQAMNRILRLLPIGRVYSPFVLNARFDFLFKCPSTSSFYHIIASSEVQIG